MCKAMYENTTSRMRGDDTYSDAFVVKVGVHQGPILSPILFIIVLEALSVSFVPVFPGSCCMQMTW